MFELDDPDLDEDEENTEVGKLIIFSHTRASQTIPCHQSLSGNLISYVCPVTPPEAYISQIHVSWNYYTSTNITVSEKYNMYVMYV